MAFTVIPDKPAARRLRVGDKLRALLALRPERLVSARLIRRHARRDQKLDHTGRSLNCREPLETCKVRKSF